MSATTQFSSDVPSTAPYHPSDSHGSIPRSDGARRSGQPPQHSFNDNHQHRPNGIPGMPNMNRSSQQSRPMNHHPGVGMPSTSSAARHVPPPAPYAAPNTSYRAGNNPPPYRREQQQQQPTAQTGGPIRNNHRSNPVNPPPYSRPPQQHQLPQHQQQPHPSQQHHSRSHQQQPLPNVPSASNPAPPSASSVPPAAHQQQQKTPQTRPAIQPLLTAEKRIARNQNMAVFRNAIEVASLVPNEAFVLMKVQDQYYNQLMKIGQGTFGQVFKAKCKTTNTIVALKKILMEKEVEGFPITALREINMLKSLRHPNVTELMDICSSGSKEKGKTAFYLVLAFCDHDLAGILQHKGLTISAVDAKTMLKHLFQGLAYIHSCEVLHRDMKTANVLVSKDGYLKLADFGLSRPKINTTNGAGPCYTNRVVTMWYRPPELLLGERNYAGEIDVWGAGCIMAEFWTRVPIFQGSSEQKQLELICRMCGSINESTMQRAKSLPLYPKIDPVHLRGSREVAKKFSFVIKIDSAVDLIDRIFTLEPSMRPSAADCLKHQYFNEIPYPRDNVAEFMRSPVFRESHFEFTSNRQPQPRPQQRPPVTRIPQNQMVDRVW